MFVRLDAGCLFPASGAGRLYLSTCSTASNAEQMHLNYLGAGGEYAASDLAG